jgi:hypothetical protein
VCGVPCFYTVKYTEHAHITGCVSEAGAAMHHAPGFVTLDAGGWAVGLGGGCARWTGAPGKTRPAGLEVSSLKIFKLKLEKSLTPNPEPQKGPTP